MAFQFAGLLKGIPQSDSQSDEDTASSKWDDGSGDEEEDDDGGNSPQAPASPHVPVPARLPKNEMPAIKESSSSKDNEDSGS